jgi:hypothetical protein
MEHWIRGGVGEAIDWKGSKSQERALRCAWREEPAMSVFMTLKIPGNPQAMEQYATANKEKLHGVVEAAKRHGLIAHRFYGSDDGSGLMVLDEWPDRQSFEEFFQEQQSEIQPMMAAAGATGQPEATFWEELKTGDAYGWGA